MISPFEDQTDNNLPGMPVRLLNGAPEKKNVSRLEFHSLDLSKSEPMQNVDAISSSALTEAHFQERTVALEAQFDLQLKQVAAQLEAAESEARAHARREWEEELQHRIAIEQARVVRICEEFGRERVRYFAEVEAEVVKLSLAVAARVLHREVNLDPLLLTATVRIALEKIADNSATKVHVPLSEVESWRKGFAEGADCKVEFIGDERLGAGECTLDTNVGRVNLGVSAQLEEIEKGFFDLLSQRPS